jgi:hypothetical protein
MTKNIIIGSLLAILLVVFVFSYTQYQKANEAYQKAMQLEEIANQAKQEAEYMRQMQLEQTFIAEEMRKKAEEKVAYLKDSISQAKKK